MAPRELHVGIVGAGMGGLAAAIAIARAGAKVTLLEAAPELGEIGAGIQIFPNVSRFLIRWGVDKIIGDNLVEFDSCNTYEGPDANLIARSTPKAMNESAGFPWWVARRDHLHAGLSEAARRHGVDLIVSSRVCHMDDSGEKVILETDRGIKYTFDFVIGADGIKSFVRQKIFPDVVPKAPSKVAAYRGVLAYDKIFADFPEARTFLGNTMDVWIGPNGYILTYPISGGKELNVVTAFCKDDYVTQMEHVDVDEFRSYYKDYSPVIQGLLKMVNYTQRWPLLQMPPLKAWSNERKNVVLLGDAVHCMQNHMAQGAATAIEDGAFLGRVVSEVVRGTITIADAVSLYEKSRIPKAWVKQQISFVSGDVNMAVDRIEQRTQATSPEILAFHQNPVRPEPLPPMYRSWQFYSNPESVPGIFYYDAEGDADSAVCEYLCSKGQVNESEMLSLNLKDKWWGYMVDNGFRKRADLAIHKGLSEEDYRKYGKGL